jgi:hypothetical protein
MFRKVDTDSEAAARLLQMFREYHTSAGTESTDAVNIIFEVLEQEHLESQDRFDADALKAIVGDVKVALENEEPMDVDTETTFVSPVERKGLRMMAASEYFRETIDYFPDDTPTDVFQNVMGILLLELEYAHQEVEEIEGKGDETAADRQDHALHCIYHNRIPYRGRKSLPYMDQVVNDGYSDDLPCTREYLAETTDELAAALWQTIEDLIEIDEYGKATFQDLRQIGRWFHMTDIEQYDEQYEAALELLYGILELRRLSVIFGKTSRARSLDSVLEFCYIAIVTQGHMKTRWRETVIKPMKRREESDDDADSSND